jgi:hypothetical protein
MSIKVRKKNGRLQKYRASKLIRSLQEAGLETGRAKIIVSLVNVKNKMTTADLKKQVYEIARKFDKDGAEKYRDTRDLEVREELMHVDGYGLVTDDTMTDLGLHMGESVDLFNGGRFEKIRTYNVNSNGSGKKAKSIYISTRNMIDIGVHRGSRVAIRKHVGLL